MAGAKNLQNAGLQNAGRNQTQEAQLRVAGVDEVGRGCLFGPVVAAAVILSPLAAQHLQAAGVRDSKQLRSRIREKLAQDIRTQAQGVAIGYASVQEIDRLNILQASLLAMRRAIGRLSPPPDLCLVDGNQVIPHLELPQRTVIKGDQTEIAIAAASIVAKVWRDTLIVRLATRYPGYDLAANKGYGSQRHRDALARLGTTPQHRRSFRSCQLVLPLEHSITDTTL
ncbi:ribonuclease HII [Leptolyngbya sp. PCC 6406]|uniref:ribonuclease HII n=1 Tax=Leptolyngbya sp. PCC 6406 TaxID=1173264 RepID=UPI0002AC4499|nr:ribonuclease HII [Leptolyngbya sp. PCC 6406]